MMSVVDTTTKLVFAVVAVVVVLGTTSSSSPSSSSSSSFLFVGADSTGASSTSSSSSSSPSEYFGGQNHRGYVDWASQSPVSDWSSRTFLASAADPSDGAALHWSIDDSTSTLRLGVATKSTGWVAVGMSVAGGMLGSDLFVVEASNLTRVIDMHVLDARLPVVDECQNWRLQSAQVSDDGFLLVTVERALDTGDSQDLPIRDDRNYSYPVSHVVAAWGDDAALSYHGPKRAHSAVRWHSDGSPEAERFASYMAALNASSYLRVGAANHSVLLNETEYAYFCSRPSDLAASGIDATSGDSVTIVGFEPVIDNVPHVHHFILYASSQDLNDTAECSRGSLNSLDLVYLWGPGEPPFVFPDDVGMPMGGSINGTRNAYRTFVLEIHYDNPTAIPDQLDSSGVRAYYTAAPRKYEAGVFSAGDPGVSLRGQSIDSGLASYRFECASSCSTLMLGGEEAEPVTVIREYLHMHQSGYAMYNEHVRNGQVIRTGGVDFFEFAMSGGPAVQQEPFQILPGDSFNVNCYYRNAPGENRTFGLASSEEMCISFLLYYPRKTLQLTEDLSIGWLCSVGFADFGFPQCDAPLTVDSLGLFSVPGRRTFGNASEQCSGEGAAPSGNATSTETSDAAGTATFAPLLVVPLLILLVGTAGFTSVP